MDINKIKEIIIDSKLSDESKALIISLLPYADQQEVKDQILEIMDIEAKLNDLAADEAEENIQILEETEKEIEVIENNADSDLENLLENSEKQLADLKARYEASLME